MPSRVSRSRAAASGTLLVLAATSVLFLFARSAYAAGTVSGRVLLPEAGPPPRMPERYRAISPNVAMEAPDAPAAIVYLQPAVSGAQAAPSTREQSGDATAPANAGGKSSTATAQSTAGGAKVSVAQNGLQFRPGLVAVRTGETVQFPNLDETYHSVFSYSKTKRFDLGRYRKGEEPASIVFDKPGVVKLFCEIHDHMRGAILVLDTPYFTKTGADGSFRIEGVPAGRYRLTAWMDEDHTAARDIDVADGQPGNAVELDVR
jgi:plastocyanin